MVSTKIKQMEKQETIYKSESKREPLLLTEEQKDAVRGITLGIEEVDETIRTMAVEDAVRTLENGHLLNRIVTNQEEKIIGYIACEDFVPHEAYIKYFGTDYSGNRYSLRQIPEFLEYAKQHGYTKINFHGWNERLNHFLERYGFQRIKTDSMAGFEVDFYEKPLVEQKSSQQVDDERRDAFEQKYLTKLNQEYQQTLAGFSEESRPQKEQLVTGAFEDLGQRLMPHALESGEGKDNFQFGKRQQIILKLKLARWFQHNDTIDLNDLYDAIIESPKFINTDKGSLYRLLEVHQEKTTQNIAEMRKKRAEMGDKEVFNPWENLFTTQSGKYYVARLLNMPHLEKESEYMNHCVGTSNSYVNQIKRGEIEILSFRHVPKFNQKQGKLEGDTPIITIEYNLKTKTIEQMKKQNDEYLKPDDPYFDDVIDALKQLRATPTDTGELRNFNKISTSELENIKVEDYYILTEHGEVLFRDFDPDKGDFILKMGDMQIVPDLSREDIAKIVRIVARIDCKPEEIAQNKKEVTEATKMYIGELFPGFFQWLPDHIQYIYTQSLEKEIRRETVNIGGATVEQLEGRLDKTDDRGEKLFQVSSYARDMLHNPDFTTLENREQINLIRLQVRDLGFDSGATTDEIYQKAEELGLELCPAEVGPDLRLQYMDQPLGEWFRIAMKQIADRSGDPSVFNLERSGDGLWLDDGWAEPGSRWAF